MNSVQEYEPATDGREVILLDPREVAIEPRRNMRYAEHELGSIKKLADSFLREGQLQPIIVRLIKPAPIAGGKKYEVVAGTRRLQAAMLIRKKQNNWKIRAVIHDIDEVTALQYNVSENLHRSQLSPIDLGMAAKVFVEEHGWSGSRIAKFMQLSQGYVSMLLAVMRLPREILDQVHDKQLTIAAAYKLTMISPEKARIIAPKPTTPHEKARAVENRKERSILIEANAKRAAGQIVKPSQASVEALIEMFQNSVPEQKALHEIMKILLQYSQGRISRTEAFVRFKDLL